MHMRPFSSSGSLVLRALADHPAAQARAGRLHREGLGAWAPGVMTLGVGRRT